MVDEAATNNNFAVGEQLITGEIGHSKCGGVKHNVASNTFEDQRAAVHGLLDIDQHFEWFVIDDHSFGGVFALVCAFGENDCDWLANVANLFCCKHRAQRGWVICRRRGLKAKISGCIDRNYAGGQQRFGNINAKNVGVGNSGAHVSCVQRTR